MNFFHPFIKNSPSLLISPLHIHHMITHFTKLVLLTFFSVKYSQLLAFYSLGYQLLTKRDFKTDMR